MPLTEAVTIPLSPRQLAMFVEWQREKQRIDQQINLAADVIVGGQYVAEEVQGCAINVTDHGLVITPPVQSPLKLEAGD